MGRVHNLLVSSDQRQAKDHGWIRPHALRIVLLNPRIPQNTGSIARLCAATGSHLDLINPLFKIDDTKLKRAGLDYWPLLNVRSFESFQSWQAATPNCRFWLVEVGGKTLYSSARFARGDALVFGDEQAGIDEQLLQAHPDQHLHLPQINVRSINLAISVGVVTFEAYRQLDFPFARLD